MRTPRGSINHHLSEDIQALFSSFINRKSIASSSDEERVKAEGAIKKYYKVEDVELYPYARTAFYAILKALDIGKGGRILMTPINIFPMREVAEALGITVEFVDIFYDEFFLPRVDDLEKHLKTRPDCFLLAHLFGYSGKILEISNLCKSYGVFLIEDISQSIGCRSEDSQLGTFGDAAICSCSITKYVDSYGGAFALFKDSNVARKAQLCLHTPNVSRLRGIVLKTFIWNLLLNRIVFSVITFNSLWILKRLAPEKFESILGPSILKKSDNRLPRSYFDDISIFQTRVMQREFGRLNTLVQGRIKNASRFAKAYLQVYFKDYLNIKSYALSEIKTNSYWQILVEVDSLNEARHRLFAKGIESGGTNLPLLIDEKDKSAFPGAHFIKYHLIFIPSHSWLSTSDYAKILNILKYKGE